MLISGAHCAAFSLWAAGELPMRPGVNIPGSVGYAIVLDKELMLACVRCVPCAACANCVGVCIGVYHVVHVQIVECPSAGERAQASGVLWVFIPFCGGDVLALPSAGVRCLKRWASSNAASHMVSAMSSPHILSSLVFRKSGSCLMLSPKYLMPEEMDFAMDLINYCFTVYFVIEVHIRLVGLGPDLFFGTFMNT
eukprot:1160568-Pelagomonas_calceolata.AAC.15